MLMLCLRKWTEPSAKRRPGLPGVLALETLRVAVEAAADWAIPPVDEAAGCRRRDDVRVPVDRDRCPARAPVETPEVVVSVLGREASPRP